MITPPMKPGIFKKCAIVSMYLSSSAATFDLNKYIISVLDFKMHYLLILIQSLIIVGIILVQSIFSLATFRYSNVNRWWMMAVLLAAMMLTNMKALYYMPLSLFTLYKNTTIVLIAVLEFYLFAHPITAVGILSFILMIGSSVFGNTIEKIPLVGYGWMVANVLSTAAYVLYLKKLMVVDMVTRTESVFFSNLLSVPMLLVLSLRFDGFEALSLTPGLVASVGVSGMMAYLVSFSTAWSVKSLSSTSYSMLGAMNKLIVSASGFLIFDEKYEVMKMVALLIGILAGMLYSIDSIRKQAAVVS